MKCDYIFGYGSLVNDKSRRKSIAKKRPHAKTKRNIPSYIDKKFGYTKKYNVTHKKELVLGLESNKHNPKDIYGLLFEVTNEDLGKLTRRERYYKLKRIPNKYLRTSVGRKRIPAKKVCTFLPKRKYKTSKRNQSKKKINPLYKKTVRNGFTHYNMPVF